MPEVPFYVQVGGALGAAIPAFVFMSVVSWKVIAQVWGHPMITAKVPALDGQIDALRTELQTAIADSRKECSDDFAHLTNRLEDGRDQIFKRLDRMEARFDSYMDRSRRTRE